MTREFWHWIAHIFAIGGAWLYFFEKYILNRRRIMELKQLAEIPGLIPEVLTFISDVKAVVADLKADPNAQKALTDGEALETRIKTIFGIDSVAVSVAVTSTPAPTPEPPAAA